MTVRRRKYTGARSTVMKWVIDIDYCHRDGSRERVRRTSPIQTRRGAEQFERELRASLQTTNARNIWTAESAACDQRSSLPKHVSFSEFAEDFLQRYARANNKPSEVDSKRSILSHHLLPTFGRAGLDDIDERVVEAYKAQKRLEALSPKTINNHLGVLGRMLRVAKAWGVTHSVPVIRFLRLAPPDHFFLSFEQTQALIDAADEGLWRSLITVAVRTGLRLGELRALTERDYDAQRRQLVVRRAAWRHVVGSPKSGRSRVVDLSDQAEEALQSLSPRAGSFLFSKSDGDMLTRESCKWPLWRACDRARLGRRIGWHVLRHTFASHLVSLGVPLRAVQELLGHADVKMTMRYAHLAPRERSRAIRLLNNASSSATTDWQ